MVRLKMNKNGGEWVINDDGIEFDNSIFTLILIILFGGNVEDISIIDRKPLGVFYKDFWGNCNDLNNEDELFNSTFEKTLYFTPITSGNISTFEGAAEDDLSLLQRIGVAERIEADGSIVDVNKIRVDIDVFQPSIEEPESMSLIWDATVKVLEVC